MTTKFTDTLPRFYLVDDIYVKVELIGDNVVATNQLGNPYPVFKAMEEGQNITEDQYLGAVGAVKRYREKNLKA